MKVSIKVNDIKSLMFKAQSQSTPNSISDIEEYVNMQTKIAHIIQGEENMEMEKSMNDLINITYSVTPIVVETNTFFGDKIVSHEVEEINEGYILSKGRYFRSNGKYKTFAKKEEAVTTRIIYEYEHKNREIQAEFMANTPNVQDEQTLIFQEGMSTSEETSEFQNELNITMAKQAKEGTNVVVTGECVEWRNRDLTNMEGREFKVRHFRLAEFSYSVELVEVGLKPIMVGTILREIVGMDIFKARNVVEKLLKEKESSVIFKGTKEKASEIREALKLVGANVEITKVEGKSIWVKPGLRVFMKTGDTYRVHGVVKRMSLFQPRTVTYEVEGNKEVQTTKERFLSLQSFLTEEEKTMGVKEFTFLSPARFVKYVPEDITGKTGNESELSDEQFVSQVLSGYEYSEVLNPNDYLINPMSDKPVPEEQESENVRMYAWKPFMLQVTGIRPWNKAELSGMGSGLDDLLSKIVSAEEYIADKYHDTPEVVQLMRKLGKGMTGDETLVATFKDQNGVWQHAEAEVIGAMEEMEALIFAKERKEYTDKAMERLEKHWTGRMEGETIMVTGGFYHSILSMEKGQRQLVYSVIQDVRKEVEVMRSELQATKMDDQGNLVKVYDFSQELNPGKAWMEATVYPIANKAIDQLKDQLNVTWLAKSLKDGLVNLVSMLMRGEIVPFTSKERGEAVAKIEEKALSIKFYGGVAVGQFWKAFNAWQMLKRMQEKEETGAGHVDDPTADQDLKEKQMDAEAKAIKGWEPKFPKEPRMK